MFRILCLGVACRLGHLWIEGRVYLSRVLFFYLCLVLRCSPLFNFTPISVRRWLFLGDVVSAVSFFTVPSPFSRRVVVVTVTTDAPTATPTLELYNLPWRRGSFLKT